MADRWYASDHHLMHWNIIKYCDRPFTSVADMNDALLTWHNELVKPQDHVSFLGDVTIRRGSRLNKEWFTTELKRYNGHKRLYLGNHDHMPIAVYMEVFEKIYATWRSEEDIVFSHIPIHPKSMGSAIANVHGHIHEAPDYEPVIYTTDTGVRVVKPYVNICVEKTNYRPIHLDEVLQRIRLIQEKHQQ